MRIAVHWPLVLVLWTPAAVAGTQAAVDPCDRPVSGAHPESWVIVRDSAFTFCIPASWHQKGRHRWAGGDGWVEWGWGTPPESYRIVRGRTRLRVEAGIVAIPAPCAAPIRRTEINEERSVDLFSIECQRRYYTHAVWTSPAIFLRGESSNETTARLLWDVYRTVRFNDPVPPSPRVKCDFDTAAASRLLPVAVGLAPSRQVDSGSTDPHRAAEAIKLHFRAPQRLSLPLWARIDVTDSAHLDPSDALGHGLDTELSFRLTDAGRLVDSSIELQTASPELDSSLVKAIRRADSARAFTDTGLIALRVMDWTKRLGAEVGLVRLVIPTIRADSAPRVVSINQLQYPELAMANQIEDAVTLEFVVTELGGADPTTFRIVSGEYQEFAIEAMNAVVQGRFVPARVGACPVPALLQQVIEFRVQR